MATNPVTSKAKTGSPAGVVSDPRTAPGVSPGTQSQTRALRRVASITAPRGTSLSSSLETYRKGTPEPLLSQRQFFREELGRAEEEYYGAAPFEERTFAQQRPEFDRKAVTRVMPMLMVMTALGGSRTKISALGMMKALGSGIKGLQEGNDKAYKQALFDYQQNYKEFQDREAARRRQYDLLREAKKDGLQLAQTRAKDADKAVDDYNEEVAADIKMQLTLDQNRRALEKHNADISLTRAQADAAIAKPKEKKSFLTAEQVNKTMLATRLLNDVNNALDVMEKRPQDFSTTINAAYTWSPKATELASALTVGPLAKQSAAVKAAIPSQQAWRRALNTQVVQNAGLSQTVAEMNSQLAAFGSQTLEARKSGMARVRLSLLQDLKDKSELSDDLKAALEAKIGMPLSQAVDLARKEVDRIEAEVRGEAPVGGEEITQAEYDQLIRDGFTPAQIKAEGYYVRGRR